MTKLLVRAVAPADGLVWKTGHLHHLLWDTRILLLVSEWDSEKLGEHLDVLQWVTHHFIIFQEKNPARVNYTLVPIP